MRKLVLFALASSGVVGFAGLPAAADNKTEEPKIVVPYVPTHQKVVEAMLKLAAVKEGDTLYDLGCGDGRFVITAVKDFHVKRAMGVDFNPERLKDCEKSTRSSPSCRRNRRSPSPSSKATSSSSRPRTSRTWT